MVLRSPIHANEPSEYNGMLYRTSNRVLNNGIRVIILICIDGTSQYHHDPKNIAIPFMDATIDLNKGIQCANPLYRSLKCLFIFFATTTTLSNYTRPWTATFFDVFMLISISWIWIKQSPCGFHRIRPDSHLKHLILIRQKLCTSIFNILFPEGSGFLTHPVAPQRITQCRRTNG